LIVLDASAAVELVLQTPRAARIAARALACTERLHAPHLIDLEVAQVLRRLALGREISAARAGLALTDFQLLSIERHAHNPLLARVWELRTGITAYDAAYIALSEALAAPLLTCDDKLARTRGHTATVELISLHA